MPYLHLLEQIYCPIFCNLIKKTYPCRDRSSIIYYCKNIIYNNKKGKGENFLTKQEDKQLDRIIFGISLFVVFPFIILFSVFQLIVRMFLLSEIPPQVTNTEFIFFLSVSIGYLALSSASILFLFRSKVQLFFPSVLFFASSLVWILASYNTTNPYNINTLGITTNLILFLITTIKFLKSYYKKRKNSI